MEIWDKILSKALKRAGFAALFGLLVITACAPTSNNSTSAEGDFINVADVSIPDTTKPLDDVTIQNLASVTSDGTLTFSENTVQLMFLQKDDVIALGVTEATPNGLLRKVISKTTKGNEVVVTTSQAELTDAFNTLSLDMRQTMKPLETSLGTPTVEILAKGVTLKNPGQSDGIENTTTDSNKVGIQSIGFSFNDVAIYDDGAGNSVKVNGSVSFDVSFDFSVRIATSKYYIPYLDRVSFTATAKDDADISIKCKGYYELNKRIKVARIPVPTIAFPVGPVPMVFVPVIDIYVGVDGKISSEMSSQATQHAEYTAGIAYTDKDGWTPINPPAIQTHSFTPPSKNGTLYAKAYAGPDMALLIYGIGGPFVNLEAYVKLDADITRTPWWKLDGGITANAGVKMDLLLVDFEYSTNIFNVVWLIAQAGDSGDRAAYIPPPEPPTNLTATSAGTIVDLQWNPTDRAQGYNIYRDKNFVGTSNDETLFKAATTYRDTPPSPGTSYSYYVTATSDTGMSSPSNTVNIVDSCLPFAPKNLTAVSGNGKVNLTWEDEKMADFPLMASYPLTRTNVLRTVYITYLPLGFSPPTTNALKNYLDADTTLVAGQSYGYAIENENSCGKSSQVDVIVTVNAGLGAPKFINDPANPVAVANIKQVNLKWTSVPGAVKYYILRYQPALIILPLVTMVPATSSTSESYTDTNVSFSIDYTYYVYAEDSTNVSGPLSPSITVNIPKIY